MSDEPYSKLSRYVLDNGLPVIIDERPMSDTVFCGIYVKVGSRYETKKNNGISHFLEHLLFREQGATPTVKQIEATGGFVNGVTTFEHTNYYFDTLASEFERAWDGLYRLVCEPSFGEHEVELERKIILREVAGVKSNPLAIAYYAAMKEFLPNTSLSMPIPGTRKSLKRISFPEIKSFYDTYYVPNNMFVVIVGGVDGESVVETVRRTFAQRESDRVRPTEFTLPPPRERPRELRLKTLVDQGYLAIGVLTDGEQDKYKYEMELIDVILGSGRNSRIYKELKVARGMTDFIMSLGDMVPADASALSDIGIWGVAVGTPPKDLAQAERIILDEMNRIKTEPVAADEFEVARKKLLGRFAIECETNSGRASFYAVTRESIAEAARDHFEDKDIMLLDVTPARGLGKLVAIVQFLVFKRI
jgi:predicted Zn-dependent peptidase